MMARFFDSKCTKYKFDMYQFEIWNLLNFKKHDLCTFSFEYLNSKTERNKTITD